MSKHTIGPWFYDSGEIWSESQLDPENKPYVFRGEEALAAVLSRNSQDARLMAAAPEMLDALKRVICQFKAIQRHVSGLYKKRSPAFENEKLLIASICNGGIVEISELLKKVEGEE